MSLVILMLLSAAALNSLGEVILHSSPFPVYEGDSLTLTCEHMRGYSVNSTTFYKGNQTLESNRNGSVYLRNVDKTATDTYTCRKVIILSFGEHFFDEDSAYIIVRELFSDPEIKILSPLSEGAAMTLTCDTRLAPLRAHTELQFAFYRNGLNVQEFGKSSQHRMNSVQPKDSGNYTCEVKTENDGLKKTSGGISIVIRETTSYFQAFLKSTVLLALLLILFIFIFVHKLSVLFIKKRRPEQRTGN